MPVRGRALRERRFERARMRRGYQDLLDIKTEVAGLREEMKAAVELLQKHQSRIIAQDNRMELLDQKIRGILNGRVWKSLEMIGRLPRTLLKRP
jgi:hypothetical protein